MRQRLVGHFLFRGEIVLVTPAHCAIGDDQPRLMPAGHGRQPIHVDVLLGRPDLAGVEKQERDGAVIGHQFLDLAVDEIDESPPPLRFGGRVVVGVAGVRGRAGSQ